ncbi:phosphocarrier protein [Orenia metallireducens]|jgi:phosphocarrier protein|uniref:Phosphocarrier protein HPr n=1 Tax=Orenia metallireducens TaxID=1413210 RepID=A0A285GBR0_9FIRM|nr:HPr family phosphocarrier protein [Orenia metallireducens]PRX32558.1 phosphocarrier protein [Orenia metallireducens]SNY20848.1 phosphocarrier protein [Orenia metallireducens]
MLTQKITIQNKTGLHARPASLLIDAANKFNCDLQIIHENREANLKSIISVMSLAIGYGEEIIIKADGKDEELALAKIIEIINNKFGEE